MSQAPEISGAGAELRQLLDDRFTQARHARELHGRDEGPIAPGAPDAVAFPRTTQEVSAIAKICSRHRVPMIPFGAGTSLEGQVVATRGGVCIDLGGMDQVLSVRGEDLDATVQAGVTRRQLNRQLRDQGLFFSVDPGADATFGGMASTRASGTNAVRYGTMRENVLALTVVLADGRVIHTGGRARKSAAGYDLTRLFVGAEGTLGIITELTVRLHGRAEAMSSAVCGFADLPGAVNTVIEAIQLGLPIARIELLDEAMMAAVNRHAGLDHAQIPTLFLEFHGSPAGVREQAATAGSIAREHGGGDFRWTALEEERHRLWRARHDVAYACKALRPGCEIWPTDVCVPISALAECLLATREDIETSGLVAPIVGHVGDGNFHVVMVVDTDDPLEMRRAEDFNDRLIRRALSLGGTCSGEHGVGLGKRKHLEQEHGGAVAVMRQLKTCLDPFDLMNPGKIFP